MAKDYEIELDAHPNIYDNLCTRKFKVYFSEPDYGINKETGLLLFIAGYGGNAHSNVYKKMRKEFADIYNMVTIQCDYFGQEYMQDAKSFTGDFSYETWSKILDSDEIKNIYHNGNFNFQEFLRANSQNNVTIKVKANLDEKIGSFNDMGLMQAIDNINAVLAVNAIINDNDLYFNTKKIIIYGHSHGAYLGYLCNALNPSLFSLLIDNSAWLFPGYLENTRHLFKNVGQMTIDIEFDYIAKSILFDSEILSLPKIYKKFVNKCKILSFHGSTDNLISLEEKEKFLNYVDNSKLNKIDKRKLDGKIFKSTNHGLDSDFLYLFEHVMKTINFEDDTELHLKPVKYHTDNYKYELNYDSGLSFLYISEIVK